MKDAAGCFQTKNITVAAAAALTISPFVRNASSCAADGSVEIYRSGGIPPYQYALDLLPYGNGNIFPGLAAGNHTAYVKDAAGCITSQVVNVAAGAGLFPTQSHTNTSTCVADGTIQLNANGGGVAPYSYKLDAIYTIYQPGNSFNNLPAGNYVGTVKDSKGCTGTVNINIALNTIIVTASATAAANCASNGTLQLFRTGGVGPYTYSIDGNTYQNGTTFPSITFPTLLPGTYSGYVKDSKGCIGVLNGIVVGPTCPVPPIAGGGNSKGSNLDVKVVNDNLKVNAYPNPTATEFTLKLEGFGNDKVSITVTDIMGRKVYMAEGSGSLQYVFGNKFTPGIYNVQVIQGDKKQTIKLVKE